MEKAVSGQHLSNDKQIFKKIIGGSSPLVGIALI